MTSSSWGSSRLNITSTASSSCSTSTRYPSDGVAPRRSTSRPEHLTDTDPAAPRHVSVTPLGSGPEVEEGSGSAGLLDVAPLDPGVGVTVGGVESDDVGRGVAAEGVGTSDALDDDVGDRGLLVAAGGALAGTLAEASGPAAEVVEPSGEPTTTPRPAESITRQVTAAATTTVRTHTTTPTRAERPSLT